MDDARCFHVYIVQTVDDSSVPDLERTAPPFEGAGGTRKRRLARKSSLARESRKKKKQKMEFLEVCLIFLDIAIKILMFKLRFNFSERKYVTSTTDFGRGCEG